MSSDASTGDHGLGSWAGAHHQAMTAHEEAEMSGNPVGIVVVGLVSVVPIGALAGLAGFGLVLSILIGWGGSILSILGLAFYLDWKCERAERAAEKAPASARQAGRAPSATHPSCAMSDDGDTPVILPAPRGTADLPAIAPGHSGHPGHLVPQLSLARAADPAGEGRLLVHHYR